MEKCLMQLSDMPQVSVFTVKLNPFSKLLSPTKKLFGAGEVIKGENNELTKKY